MTNQQKKMAKRQAWRNFMREYWKGEAKEEWRKQLYSQENINRMNMGKAPRRLALIRHSVTGETIEYHAPLELHHVFGYHADEPQDTQTLIECYPWQHALIDNDRHFNWQLVEWRSDL